MVASSSNLLLVAASTAQGHVRTGSTIPNDHDLTMTNFSNENRRGYMIRSTSTNNISGISGTNLKDMIMLETVAPAYASTASAPLTSASGALPSAATTSEGKQSSGPRPSSSDCNAVVVALPESPTRKQERAGEQRDDIESVFNNIRSATNRKVLAFDLSAPTMPDMMMLMPALPTPAMNQSSKQKNEMSNSNNDNVAPMKKKKKNQLHMGRRLRQIKKRLTLSKSGSKSSKQEQEEVCLSHGTSATTSATTSTLSFGPTSEEDDDNVPFMDEMDMMSMNMTTTLKPRIRSMFHEDEEDMMMMPMMPVLPAPLCPLSTLSDDVVTTPSASASFSSKLDQALSVLSPNDAVADDTADEWGVFASYDDDDEEDHHDQDIEPKYNHFKSKASHSRSSFTKHATANPCFQPRANLPVFATAGAE